MVYTANLMTGNTRIRTHRNRNNKSSIRRGKGPKQILFFLKKMAPGSRRSIRSSTPIPMPVIAEDENAADPRRHGATTPTVPPRSPHRRPPSTRSTRSSGVLGSANNNSLYTPSTTRPALSRASSVPQYVPKRVPGIRAVGGEVGSVRSIPLNSNGSERWVILPTTERDREGTSEADGSPRPAKGKSEDGRGVHGGKDKDMALGGWVRRRGRWYKVVVLGILVIGLIVGLAVGLTIGLRKRYILLSFFPEKGCCCPRPPPQVIPFLQITLTYNLPPDTTPPTPTPHYPPTSSPPAPTPSPPL